jgi:bifunctional non-homologous end joining protein LigD
MQPTLVARPFHVEGFVYEEKIDGYRMAAYKLGGTVRLISRQGIEHTRRFRDLAAAIAALPYEDVILDGEVAVFVSRFEWLRGRPSDEVATPPMFMVFDCLRLDGVDTRPHPLHARRSLLERVLDGVPPVLLPVRRLAADGLEAWEEVLNRGYEGLVAKDVNSPYISGPTLAWRKVKQKEYRVKERGFYKL